MSEQATPRTAPRLAPSLGKLSNVPWWLLVAILIGLFIVYEIITDDQTNTIFFAVGKGIRVTFIVTISAYTLALVIGLLVGFGRVSKNPVAYNIATFYVEVIRGVPMLVLLMYIAFVAVPSLINGINALGDWLVATGIGTGEALTNVTSRNVDNTVRVIVGLGVAYGAFSAEIFRAGIESIEKGQMEAARALGMSYFQAMRLVILPQAVRRVLPALGNDFVAMVKDSSLVSVLGVQDITQLAKLYAASTFLFFQTYSILAFIYLIITILLTRFVRWLERRMRIGV
ncbi:MAG: amino acid ABC transporter permease [Chloroflexi bacterium]|nr:MAG: amino acid ABC transporter permease [Chloroflexota bacterium]